MLANKARIICIIIIIINTYIFVRQDSWYEIVRWNKYCYISGGNCFPTLFCRMNRHSWLQINCCNIYWNMSDKNPNHLEVTKKCTMKSKNCLVEQRGSYLITRFHIISGKWCKGWRRRKIGNVLKLKTINWIKKR